jgi:hypothetical protein
MKGIVGRVRKPVRREGGETYVLYTLLSFAASVALTRLFLELTGYPQLGGSTLHIAHVLWGGLLLFIAAMIPLIFANRWVYTVGALMAGIGVGLFMDEVGKFITQTNDYFYPAAAPIIYAFFLLTVLVYLQTRKPKRHSARAELYRALDTFTEVLDRDLEPNEFGSLAARLSFVVESNESEELTALARELLQFIASDAIRIQAKTPSFFDRITSWWSGIEDKWFGETRLRAILAGGLIALGAFALIDLGRLLAGTQAPQFMENRLLVWIETGQLDEARDLIWFISRVGIEAIVGALLIIGAIMLLLKKNRWGSTIAYFSLLLSLTVSNLIVFYFDQFSTILPALVQLLMLIGVLRYRSLYLLTEESSG